MSSCYRAYIGVLVSRNDDVVGDALTAFKIKNDYVCLTFERKTNITSSCCACI